jgi:hypothetical protein
LTRYAESLGEKSGKRKQKYLHIKPCGFPEEPDVNGQGVPLLAAKVQYDGKDITGSYDLAVQWIHANAPDLGGKTPGLTKSGRQ